MVTVESVQAYRARGLAGYDVALTRRRSGVRISSSPCIRPFSLAFGQVSGLPLIGPHKNGTFFFTRSLITPRLQHTSTQKGLHRFSRSDVQFGMIASLQDPRTVTPSPLRNLYKGFVCGTPPFSGPYRTRIPRSRENRDIVPVCGSRKKRNDDFLEYLQ
jgi:hypothetical protein